MKKLYLVLSVLIVPHLLVASKGSGEKTKTAEQIFKDFFKRDPEEDKALAQQHAAKNEKLRKNYEELDKEFQGLAPEISKYCKDNSLLTKLVAKKLEQNKTPVAATPKGSDWKQFLEEGVQIQSRIYGMSLATAGLVASLQVTEAMPTSKAENAFDLFKDKVTVFSQKIESIRADIEPPFGTKKSDDNKTDL